MDMSTWLTRWFARHPLKAPPEHQQAQYTAEVMERLRTPIQSTRISASILAQLTWPRMGWAVALAAGLLVAAHVTLRTTSTHLATDVMRETEVLGAFAESVAEPVGLNDAESLAGELELHDAMVLAAAQPSDEQWIEQNLQVLDQLDERTSSQEGTSASRSNAAPSTGDELLDDLQFLDDTELSTSSS